MPNMEVRREGTNMYGQCGRGCGPGWAMNFRQSISGFVGKAGELVTGFKQGR